MSDDDQVWPAERVVAKLNIAVPANRTAQLPLEQDAQVCIRPQRVFTDNDYASNDGIQTAIFGPIFWAAIHMISFNYPTAPSNAQKHEYRNWLLATGQILPCKYCRDNFQTNIQRASQKGDFESRDAFSRLCYRLHDEVNKTLGKESPASYAEVRDMYEGFRSRCLTEQQKRELQAAQQELGCVAAMHEGTKGKCVISVVPRNTPAETFSVSESCRLR